MEYEEQRTIKIKLIGIIREWAEEHGLEISPAMESELANEIFNKILGENQC